MKKNRLLVAMLGIALCLVLQACFTYKPFVIDENIPKEQSASVYFNVNRSEFIPVAFNGVPLPTIEVFGRAVPANGLGSWLVVPASEEVTITGNMRYFVMSYDYSDIIYTADGMEFSYTFEPGKTYYIHSYIDDEATHDSGVRIYEGVEFDWQKMPYSEEDNFLAFIPFKVQPKWK
jgi:hypothetical protein